MDELRPTKRQRVESPEKRPTPPPEDMDMLRGAKQSRQEIRDKFSTEQGERVLDQLEASKISAQEFLKNLYRKRHGADLPDPQESQPLDGSPPTDLKSYRDAVMKSLKEQLHEKQQAEIDNIHQEYQRLQQKMQETPPKSLEEIARVYKDRYKGPPPAITYGKITRVIGVGGTTRYISEFNLLERKFTFSFFVGRDLDKELGPTEPPALHASNILRHHIENDLDLAVTLGYKRDNFRLDEITFSAVSNKGVINAVKDFIPSSGKPFGLNVEGPGRERVAFGKLMTSKFGEIVLWGLRDSQFAHFFRRKMNCIPHFVAKNTDKMGFIPHLDKMAFAK